MKKIIYALLFLVSQASFAADAIYTGFFSSKAVGGYDTVTYFTDGHPQKGSDAYSTTYMEATWYFVSQKNLDLFTANPTKYAPQYGGFCAWAVSEKNDRAPGDPTQWSIVDNKLYLNYDKEVKSWWEKDIPTFITKADKNWPQLLKE